MWNWGWLKFTAKSHPHEIPNRLHLKLPCVALPRPISTSLLFLHVFHWLAFQSWKLDPMTHGNFLWFSVHEGKRMGRTWKEIPIRSPALQQHRRDGGSCAFKLGKKENESSSGLTETQRDRLQRSIFFKLSLAVRLWKHMTFYILRVRKMSSWGGRKKMLNEISRGYLHCWESHHNVCSSGRNLILMFIFD